MLVSVFEQMTQVWHTMAQKYLLKAFWILTKLFKCYFFGLKCGVKQKPSKSIVSSHQLLRDFGDLRAVQYDLAINNIATSKVETGIQQKNYV